MATITSDVVIYGATMSAVIAAKRITTMRPGTTISIVEWTGRIGGLVTAGLTASDNNATPSHWGLTRQFFMDIGTKYGAGSVPYWRFEAHKGIEVLDEWLATMPTVQFYLDQPVVGVEKSGPRITSIITESDTYVGDVFLDCSYEGEVMYLAGVTCSYGRESRRHYGEFYAGMAIEHVNIQNARGTDANGDLKPNYSYEPVTGPGTADHKSQAMNYRLQGTTNPGNFDPWPAPPGYRREDFIATIGGAATGPEGVFNWVRVGPVDSGKFDVNHNDVHGPRIWEWPTASYERRRELMDYVQYYHLGSAYYRSSDVNIPQDTRDLWAQRGLAKDEFHTDYHNVQYYPPAVYVRVGRKMVSDYVIDENHIIENRHVPDSINNGGYMMDRHTVQRWEIEDGRTFSEGHAGYSFKQYYPIPLRCIRPSKGQADNLLVPVCASLSDMGWCSYRMEPTEMQSADAAGMVAALALDGNADTIDISYHEVLPHLQAANAVLRYEG